MQRRSFIFGTGGMAALALHAPAGAQEPAHGYPDKPVRVVVPYAAGGGLDTITRLVAKSLNELLGQSFLVDNRAGAGGVIGAEVVARAAPDGYTLLMAGNPELVIAPSLSPGTVHYDVLKDFAPIMLVAESPNVVIAHPSVQGSLADILAGRTKLERGVNIGTPGQGSAQHLSVAVLQTYAKEKIIHVPYKGAAPVVSDVLGGQIKLGIVGAPPVIPHLKTGKLRALAVTQPRRSALLPDVPTVDEVLGIKDFGTFNTWYGLLAPAATPKPIVERLQASMVKVASHPELKSKLALMAAELVGLAGSDFGQRMRSEVKRYEEVIRRFNIKPE